MRIHRIQAWPPRNEQHAAQERVSIPLCERQDGEPGSPARNGDGKGGEIDERLGAGASRVQHEESRVARPEERRELPSDERGGIERIADNLGQRPREHHTGVEWATLSRGKTRCDAPDREEPAGDLHGGRRQRAAHEPNEHMQDLEHGDALHARSRRAHHVVRGARAHVERHEARGDDRGHPDEGVAARLEGREEGGRAGAGTGRARCSRRRRRWRGEGQEVRERLATLCTRAVVEPTASYAVHART